MLEVIYRIYEVIDLKENLAELENGNAFWEPPRNRELTMDCKICESRDHFKELIKEEYGEDIAFRNTKKLKAGDLYCIIIGEHCYNAERYFNKVEYECEYCRAKVSAYVDKFPRLRDWEIRHDLCNQIDKYENAKFCSVECKDKFLARERQKCIDDDMLDESFISPDSFSNEGNAGYIYKISKKSTGEFYIGQTKYAPVFRWGQHLKTNRFAIENILDYQFETLEVVPISENILEREKYYIQKYYKSNPEKSLNIMCTANVDMSGKTTKSFLQQEG